jgi:hypothetical protein
MTKKRYFCNMLYNIMRMNVVYAHGEKVGK